jgi:hypothetical protein
VKTPSSKVHAFLAAIRAYPNIGAAAKAARISRYTHYKRYDRDAAYRKAFDEAWRYGVGVIRDVAIHRAVSGYQEPVIHKGRFMYDGRGKKRRMRTVTKYPERLLMRVLGAEIPDVYAPKMKVEHSGHVAMIIERLQAARKRLQLVA